MVANTSLPLHRITALPKPDRIHLLSQIRKATIDDQQAVLTWLLGKFGMIATKKA